MASEAAAASAGSGASGSSSVPLAPIVTRSSIKTIAEAVGIAHLKDEVADVLAPDVEYRLRDLIGEAIKFQKHGRCARYEAVEKCRGTP